MTRKAGWELYGREESGEEVYEGFFPHGELNFEDVKHEALALWQESQRGRFSYKSVVVKDAQDQRRVLYSVTG